VKLREARQVVQTRKLLAWVECRIIGEAFASIPRSQWTAAKREFSQEARVTPRSIENHIRIHQLTQDLHLPDEALSILQFSTVRALIEEFGEDTARQTILDVHDSDLSLMQARVKLIKQQIQENREQRKQPSLIDSLRDALGEVGKRRPHELNDAERHQARTALDSLLREET
jgi:hypothetical protein